MANFIIRRILEGIIIIILVTILVFLIMRLLPGDPLILYLGQSGLAEITTEQLAELSHQYGLDRPLIVQYISWFGGILHGDFGTSLVYKESVSRIISERLLVTGHIGILSFFFSGFLGVLLGTICGLKRGKWIDTIFTFLANIGITIPSFWAAILLIYLFSMELGWLPTGGYTSPFTNFSENSLQLLMPVFCLSLFPIASLARQTRSCVLEVVHQDYIRTAWSKGLKESVIVTRHIIKNALIPVVTMLGMNVTMIFGGSVLIETVFNIPGMGRIIINSILRQDYQVMQGCVLVTAIIVVLVNLTVDVLYGWLDPRIRYD